MATPDHHRTHRRRVRHSLSPNAALRPANDDPYRHRAAILPTVAVSVVSRETACRKPAGSFLHLCTSCWTEQRVTPHPWILVPRLGSPEGRHGAEPSAVGQNRRGSGRCTGIRRPHGRGEPQPDPATRAGPSLAPALGRRGERVNDLGESARSVGPVDRLRRHGHRGGEAGQVHRRHRHPAPSPRSKPIRQRARRPAFVSPVAQSWPHRSVSHHCG
jgi:hypothetical protein